MSDQLNDIIIQELFDIKNNHKDGRVTIAKKNSKSGELTDRLKFKWVMSYSFTNLSIIDEIKKQLKTETFILILANEDDRMYELFTKRL